MFRTGLLVILIGVTTSPCWAQTLTIAALPGIHYNEVGIPLIAELYREVGASTDVIEIPAPRQIRMLTQGQLDAVVAHPIGFNRNHPEFIRLDVPISTVKIILFTARNDLQWPLDQQSLTLGVMRGVDINDSTDLGTFPEQWTLIPVSNQEQLMRMIARYRLDIVAMPRIEGLAIIQELQLRNVNTVGPVLFEIPVYHYIHQRHADLVDPLNQVLQQWDDSGYMEGLHKDFRDELEAGLN